MDIEQILKYGLDHHSSDIHIIPDEAPLFRIDGDLITSKEIPSLTGEETKKLIHSMMNDEDQARFVKKLSVDMAVYYPGIGNFRVNAFHQRQGIAAILRVVSEKIPTIDELGLPLMIKRLLMLPYGLILVTGPTGCGKSTTLAAMVDYINTMRCSHIITIEDPIEYLHKNKKSSINQLQVGRDTRSFAAALKSSLRQDPNIIMLGEMRDLETIRLALTASETGHLVISTLHANSAPITISRIVDVFPTSERNRVRNLLSETLQAIVCQLLVKKTPSGRIAAMELLLATPAIRHLISQGMVSHIESAMQTGGDSGMFTLEQNLKELLSKGVVTQASIRAVTASRDSMRFSENKNKNE